MSLIVAGQKVDKLIVDGAEVMNSGISKLDLSEPLARGGIITITESTTTQEILDALNRRYPKIIDLMAAENTSGWSKVNVYVPCQLNINTNPPLASFYGSTDTSHGWEGNSYFLLGNWLQSNTGCRVTFEINEYASTYNDPADQYRLSINYVWGYMIENGTRVACYKRANYIGKYTHTIEVPKDIAFRPMWGAESTTGGLWMSCHGYLTRCVAENCWVV